ncbi:hypothetical protein HDU93_008108 [Gonapodya sp. JEL0774]|nr:hypothetical protein HDU93_008108 [Gonapodya sp. JEL0774]
MFSPAYESLDELLADGDLDLNTFLTDPDEADSSNGTSESSPPLPNFTPNPKSFSATPISLSQPIFPTTAQSSSFPNPELKPTFNSQRNFGPLLGQSPAMPSRRVSPTFSVSTSTSSSATPVMPTSASPATQSIGITQIPSQTVHHTNHVRDTQRRKRHGLRNDPLRTADPALLAALMAPMRRRRQREEEEEVDEDTKKRRCKNTEAARRSRLRKSLAMVQLEFRVNSLVESNTSLTTRLEQSEGERDLWKSKAEAREREMKTIEARIEAAYNAMRRCGVPLPESNFDNAEGETAPIVSFNLVDEPITLGAHVDTVEEAQFPIKTDPSMSTEEIVFADWAQAV